MSIPLVITAAGPQPTPPSELNAALIALVSTAVPGYTAVLPASMIENMSSTETYGLAMMDSARVETINSLTTYAANAFTLSQLGQLFIGPGTAPAPPTNTSVSTQFTVLDSNNNPVPGFVISVGFLVSDGTYQYAVQNGGVTSADGVSPPLYCLATIPGSWPVSSGSVSQIASSVSGGYQVSCTNPSPGTPGNLEAETEEQFRARVNQAEQAVATGTPQLLKTLVAQVSGVQARLISTRPQTGGGWEIIVGGGDPYQVAGAIFASGLDISTLVGSTLAITDITNANPGVVTTDLNHGYSNGQIVTMSEIVGMVVLNGVPVTATVVDEKRFSINVDTTSDPAYVSGGVCSPNLRNETPALIDVPDIYTIPYVQPPAQTVTIAVSYNTTDANFVAQASVAQLAAPALAEYVNSVFVGGPLSEILLEQTFVQSVASVLDPSTISVLTFAVSINGVSTPPTGQLIFGDPESFMEATAGGISVNQAT